MNHFKRICIFQNKDIETVQQNEEKIIIDVVSSKKKLKGLLKIQINALLDMQLDTGNYLTLTPRKFWKKLRKPTLKKRLVQ